MSERDIINTMIAEAGGNLDGLHAVAAVINNRSTQWGLTPSQVVKQPNQFEGYSNPGSASKKAQNDPKVRAVATKAWNDIRAGRVPDPTNGGLSFRAANAAKGMSAPNGTKNIGGNVFALGNTKPQTALAAIDQIAPNPQPRPPALAYANMPTRVRAITVNPDGSPASLVDAMRARYDAVTPSPSSAASLYGGILPRNAQPEYQTLPPPNLPLNAPLPPSRGSYYGPATDHWGPSIGNLGLPPIPATAPPPSRPDLTAALQAKYGNATPSGAARDVYDAILPSANRGNTTLATRSVQSVPINPATGNPYTTHELTQLAANTEAARLRGLVTTPGSRVANAAPVSVPQPAAKNTDDLQAALNVYAAKKAANAPTSGITKTVGQAGNVPLPPGVVPKSVQRDMAAINAVQMNKSGSPDDRSSPMPTVPKGLNVAPPTSAQLAAMNNINGAYQQPITHTAVASNERLPELPPTAYVPFKPVPPGVKAISDATANPFAGATASASMRRLPTVPVPGVTGPQPLTKFLPPNQRQNDTLTTAGNVAGNLISNTPAGHLFNWLTGGPVMGGLLGLIPAPHFGPPSAPAAQPGGVDPLQAAVIAAQRNGEVYDRSRDPSFNPNGGAHGGSLAGF